MLFTFSIQSKPLPTRSLELITLMAESIGGEIAGTATEFVFSGTAEQATRLASAIELVMELPVEYKRGSNE